jgi:excisionase family DNA binding protein
MYDSLKLDALKALLDPEIAAKWLDEVDSYRRLHGSTNAGPTGIVVPESECLLDVKEICKRLQVKPSWIYEKTRQDAIPHVRVGTYIRFRWPDVERWLAESQVGQ